MTEATITAPPQHVAERRPALAPETERAGAAFAHSVLALDEMK